MCIETLSEEKKRVLTEEDFMSIVNEFKTSLRIL